MKRELVVLPLMLVLLLMFSVSVIAEENSSGIIEGKVCTQEAKVCSDGSSVGRNSENDCEFDQCPSETDTAGEDKVEITSAGITPDSSLYFIDRFFDTFSDDISVKEEKIAEIKAMIKKGDIKSARDALKYYQEYVKKIEKEIGPEKAKEAERSSIGIRQALNEIKNNLSEADRKEFFDNIIEDEKKVVIAAKLASKIKDLCQSLSEVDPEEYYRVCKTDDNAPKWQKKLDRDLTEKQREETIKFGEIMSRCFKTSGKECQCDEIPFPEFASACSEAAPLAAACNVDGNDKACEELDSIEMPELPEHLQGVFDELEKASNSRYDIRMPKKCVEAGITDPGKCKKIIIRENAPKECREALIKADANGEKEVRKICGKIMMKKYARICAEKNIINPKECRDFMISIDEKPTKCIEEGIGNAEDCKDFLDDLRDERRDNMKIDFNCKEIKDETKRLDCYDEVFSQVKKFREHENDREEKDCGDCKLECGNQSGERSMETDCVNGKCECYYEDTETHEVETEDDSEVEIEDSGIEMEQKNIRTIAKHLTEKEQIVVNTSSNIGEVESTITGNVFLDYFN